MSNVARTGETRGPRKGSGRTTQRNRKARGDSLGFLIQPAWANEEDYADPALEQVEKGEFLGRDLAQENFDNEEDDMI